MAKKKLCLAFSVLMPPCLQLQQHAHTCSWTETEGRNNDGTAAKKGKGCDIRNTEPLQNRYLPNLWFNNEGCLITSEALYSPLRSLTINTRHLCSQFISCLLIARTENRPFSSLQHPVTFYRAALSSATHNRALEVFYFIDSSLNAGKTSWRTNPMTCTINYREEEKKN